MKAVCLLILPLAFLLSACGTNNDDAPKRSEMVLRIAPDGKDFSQIKINCPSEDLNEDAICGQLGLLSAKDFAPLPDDVICTRIYGGALLAEARGFLEGKPVDAQFNLSGGCEIERFDNVRMLYRYAFPTLGFASKR